MSAFVVNVEHLAFIVACADSDFRAGTAYVTGSSLGWFGSEVKERVADMVDILHAENIRSVNFRYREDSPVEAAYPEWSKVNAKRNALYATGGRKAVARAALMAISCLEYQSCESPDWSTTNAERLLGRLAIRCAHDAAEENSEWEMTF